MAVPRGSIFGALLLISIGGLFLWANLDPSLRPWPLIGRYWPLLIVFWGLSKLFDYFALRGTPEGSRAVRLSAGDVFLLMFLLLAGTAVSRATQRGFWDGLVGIHADENDWGRWFDYRAEYTQKLEQQIKTPGVLTLTNDGNVTLVAQAGDRLQAAIRKTAFGPNQAEAERRAREVELFLEPQTRGALTTYALRWRDTGEKLGPLEKFGPVRAQIELSAPVQLGAQFETRRGDVRVSGLAGDVTLNMGRGEAEVSSIGGNVKAEIRRGRVQVENVRGDVEVRGRGDDVSVRDVRGQTRIEGEFTGPIRAANVSGETRFVSRRTDFVAQHIEGELELDRGELHLRRATGSVNLRAEDKDIRIDEPSGPLRIENRHGSIQVHFSQPPREAIEISSRSGDIELSLPADSGFTLEARSAAGEISSDFTGAGLTGREEKGGSTLTGSYGNDRTNIRLTTRYGSIRLLRATSAPATRK